GAAAARQADGFLAFLDLDFGEVRLFEQLDELLELAQVHGWPLVEYRCCGKWSGGRRQAAQRRVERVTVAVGTEAADHAHRLVAEVAVLAEGFAGVGIG